MCTGGRHKTYWNDLKFKIENKFNKAMTKEEVRESAKKNIGISPGFPNLDQSGPGGLAVCKMMRITLAEGEEEGDEEGEEGE
jgi:hypothetical protein